ncbi:craniofacial development protein 1 isoform X2 [Neocloeon triangulifer]|uniref:craniofacial development protein 1 isoform X2 n=1 Tax=Neocloeon triangulifer TaxID=2078957 RepID=UPI00286FA85F|nr:craniofacial development protein 1 isoform X2 [Neocloeon triangulifer]
MSNPEENKEMDSDSSNDEDYVPEGEYQELSEEESGSENEDESNALSDCEENAGVKRKSKSKSRSRKRAKTTVAEDPGENKAVKVASEEEVKKKADDIWAAFKKDTGALFCNGVNEVKKPEEEKDAAFKSMEEKPLGDSSKKEEQQKIYEFAGETHVLTGTSTLKPMQQSSGQAPPTFGAHRSRGGGLAGLMSQLKGKGTKLSTLEKSKLDWQNFKSKEGLAEEIQTHNRGKQGYLERQDFLERADHRRFEIEKQMRATARRSNN